MGVVFVFLHFVILWSGVTDIFALLILATPVAGYIAYCTQDSCAAIFRYAVRIYCAFAAVVLAAAGLVYVIGT